MSLSIELDRADGQYHAGETLRGVVIFHPEGDRLCRALEARVICRTSGEGNRDEIGPPGCLRFEAQDEHQQTLRLSFSFDLPRGPVSYDGRIVSVGWLVQARADLAWTRDPMAALPFTMLPARSVAMTSGGYRDAAPSPEGGTYDLGKPSRQGDEAGVFTTDLLRLLRNWRSSRRIGAPSVTIPSSVRRGEVLAISVTLSPPTPIALERAHVELEALERAVKGYGKSPQTFTTVVRTGSTTLYAKRDSLRLPKDQATVLEGHFAMPADAPPTFGSNSNDVTWFVTVKLLLESGGQWSTRRIVEVQPA
jgi:hypothetical protein